MVLEILAYTWVRYFDGDIMRSEQVGITYAGEFEELWCLEGAGGKDDFLVCWVF